MCEQQALGSQGHEASLFHLACLGLKVHICEMGSEPIRMCSFQVIRTSKRTVHLTGLLRGRLSFKEAGRYIPKVGSADF